MTLCCGILTIETSDCFLRSFCTIGQNGAFSTTEQINKFFRGSFQLFFGQSGFHFSYSGGFVCFTAPQIRSYFILIFTVFFFPLPSVAIAVIFTVFPLADFFVVTIPLAFTVAYLVLLDIQRSFLFAFSDYLLSLLQLFEVVNIGVICGKQSRRLIVTLSHHKPCKFLKSNQLYGFRAKPYKNCVIG